MISARASHDQDTVLSSALYLLAAEIVVYVVLGPLMTGVIELRTSAGGATQVMGGDLAALLVVVPACLVAGGMVSKGVKGGALIAIAPAGFAIYTYSQIFLGSEFLARPGNVERFFPLFAATVITAAVAVARSWAGLGPLGADVFRRDRCARCCDTTCHTPRRRRVRRPRGGGPGRSASGAAQMQQDLEALVRQHTLRTDVQTALTPDRLGLG